MRIECGIDVNTSGQVRSGQIPQNQIAVPSFMSAENTLLRCGDGQRTRIMFYTRSKKKPIFCLGRLYTTMARITGDTNKEVQDSHDLGREMGR